jgi:hypothetical protein
VGGLAGAPLVPLLHRLRPGVLLLAFGLFLVPAIGLLAIKAGPWWDAGVLFSCLLAAPSIRVLLDVLVLRQGPEGQRGRMIGTVQALLGLGQPAGLAAAGLLLGLLSASAAVLVLAAALGAGVLYCSTLRPLWRASWPA